MPIALILLGLLAYLGYIALLKKPIGLDEVRWLASRENLEISSGNRMHCRIHGYLLYCEYSHVPGEEDRLRIEIAVRKGTLIAAFENGKLLWWNDGKAIYKPGEDDDPYHRNAAWLWESVLGTIQNVIATKAGMGAQTV